MKEDELEQRYEDLYRLSLLMSWRKLVRYDVYVRFSTETDHENITHSSISVKFGASREHITSHSAF
jgi:hypothetical protein